MYKRLQTWTKRYERFWIPLMLIVGLGGDVLQFTALNIWEKFTIMGVYVLVSTSTLLLTTYPHPLKTAHWRKAQMVAPFLHQFAVGGLLSTALLFYWFSGASSVSWPLLVIVALFMFGNEFMRMHFVRPTVQMAVLSFSLFSLTAIFLSFVFNSLSQEVFFLSGVMSFLFVMGFMLLLTHVGKLQHRRKIMFLTISSVFVFMIACYFGNVIPPIPLAIREAGMYHRLAHIGQDYQLTGEEESWMDQLLPGQTVHLSSGEGLYAYTSIFAPTDLTTTIVHKWQSYDSVQHVWVTQSVLSFPMKGGRDDGYRGYSRKSSVTPGKWRVSVETTRGQVLGRIGFTVVAQ